MKDLREFDWQSKQEQMNERGYIQLHEFLSREECQLLKHGYVDAAMYRSVVDMKRYRFGMGEYKYFKYPLPPIVQTIREQLYVKLAPLANQWMRALGIGIHYPATHSELIDQCKAAGQLRPTPLILRYQPGGFNTLHQDLYGDVYFPFQVLFVLTQEGIDHLGGQFVLVEQVPRAQSRAEVISPNQGDALIFTTNFRPVKGTRGYYRSTFRHGVSEVKSGERYAMGIIFHDAT